MVRATQTGKVFIPVVALAGLLVNTHAYSVGLPENNSFSSVWRKGTELVGEKKAGISQKIIYWYKNKKPLIFHHLIKTL